METLPIEILMKIFSYLEFSDIIWTTPQVCKLWKSVAADQSMVKALEVDDEYSVFDLKLCHIAVKRYKLITHFKLIFHGYDGNSAKKIFINNIIRELAQNCSYLLDLSLTDCSRDQFQEAIEILLMNCFKIQKLSLIYVPLPSIESFSKLQSLETLDLEFSGNFEAGRIASALPKSSFRLKSIGIYFHDGQTIASDCYKIINHSKCTLKTLCFMDPASEIFHVISECCELEKLILKTRYIRTIRDENWLKITALKKLKMLRIGYTTDMSPTIFKKILINPNLSNLKILSIAWENNDYSLPQFQTIIGNTSPNIVVLEIDSTSRLLPLLGLDVILSKCRKLVILDVRNVYNKPEELAEIVDFDNLPPNLKIMDIMMDDFEKIEYISELDSVKKLHKNSFFKEMSYSELRSTLAGVEPEVFQLAYDWFEMKKEYERYF